VPPHASPAGLALYAEAHLQRFDVQVRLGQQLLELGVLVCSEPTKLDRFWLESSAPIPQAGRSSAMKASRFSDAQKAFILRQGADGMPVADVCRKAGISQATYFNWKKKYDGLLPDEMRRLKQLEDENAKLKKLVADLSLDREMLQDVIRRKL
jgi:hypothetical protein